jgi:hypothetical protein
MRVERADNHFRVDASEVAPGKGASVIAWRGGRPIEDIPPFGEQVASAPISICTAKRLT